MTEKDYDYEVGLSFAGEQREYVEEVANALLSRGIRTFYDANEDVNLWGKDLYEHFSEVYQHKCRYCVMFVSKEYASKRWPNKERRDAQARALTERREYILPARFDDTPIPGLPDTVGYMDLREISQDQLVETIVKKLGRHIRDHYLPRTLDRLHERLGIEDDPDRQAIADFHAHSFYRQLNRMSVDERDAVIAAIRFGCPAELPENLHIHTDLLRRLTGKSESDLAELLSSVESLGFSCWTRKDSEHGTEMLGKPHEGSNYFCVNWVNLNSDADADEKLAALVVAEQMILGATENFCEDHGTESLTRLDFSQLSSAVLSPASHEPD